MFRTFIIVFLAFIQSLSSAELDEQNFHHRFLETKFEKEAMAVVLVDTWNAGVEDQPLTEHGWEAEWNLGKSFCEKTKNITYQTIAPMLDQCRKAGITVIYCPSKDVCQNYTQFWEQSPSEKEIYPPKAKGDNWPSEEFSSSWSQAHDKLVRGEKWYATWLRDIRPLMKIPAVIKPQDGDIVVSGAEMLHRILKEKKKTTLIYAGFATNMCLLRKSGGIESMQQKGYLPILLRDATVASEIAETHENQGMTQAFINQIEISYGYSVTSKELVDAISNVDVDEVSLPCRYVRLHHEESKFDSVAAINSYKELDEHPKKDLGKAEVFMKRLKLWVIKKLI
jgi:nicotinamidase-related amidase